MMSSLSSRLRLILAWSVAAILRDGERTGESQSVAESKQRRTRGTRIRERIEQKQQKKLVTPKIPRK
jgi:hypothetical protein